MTLVYFWCCECEKRFDSGILASIHAWKNKHLVEILDHDMTPPNKQEVH
ncbi:hypothetical protein [Methanohalobium sp.]|nr:hypothetical protein [Methanohalobium sp.]